jgi:hypothetical protein
LSFLGKRNANSFSENEETKNHPMPRVPGLKKPRLIILFILIPFIRLIAQNDSLFQKYTPAGPVMNEERIQNIEIQSEYSGSEDADYSALVEQLSYYSAHPLRINTAKKEELEALGLLNEMQINNLLDHIRNNGKLLSFYELQSIDGFELRTLRNLFPFVTVDDEPGGPIKKQFLTTGNNSLNFRYARILEQQKGFSPIDSLTLRKKPNSRFVGTPSRLFANYRFTFQNLISWGITGKKDEGEDFFRGSQRKGFDFYSAHLFFHSSHFLKTVVAGDYAVGFGQGLISWSGISFSKTADATQIKKTATGLRPYTSTNENSYLRGIGTTIGWNRLELTGFLSRKKMDASVSDTSLSGQILRVRTLQTSGLHATPSELYGRKVLQQTVEGGNISYVSQRFRTGISFMHTLFDAALMPKPELYNTFEFRGKELNNAGADYNLVFRNMNTFGEFALSSDGTPSLRKPASAFLQGMIIALDPKLSFSILYRNYQRDYHSFYANAFSSSSGSKVANEQGCYMGVVVNLTNKVTLSSFYDCFTIPWLRYRVNAPSIGNDCFIKLIYAPNKRTEIYLHMRSVEKSSDPPAGGTEEINYPVPARQTNYRIHISSLISPGLQLRSRVEFIVSTDSTGASEKGFLMAQDLLIQKPGSSYSYTFRYVLFDTPSGNTRIYAFEHTVPGAFSIPSYSYRGSRVNVLFRCKINRNLEFWASCSRTFYDNRQVISPGTLNEIQGQHKTELTLQLKWKF